ncbi:MAG: hypothetical protein P8H31_02940, partial [Porticoccaceae bacterium]|nr:hypothetical protein [Porticoccaceae bacterium]
MIIKVADSGMLPPLIEITPFRDAIERDCLILTPNHRLAAKINDAWSLAVGKTVWRAPRVYSIDHWLKYCWDELQDQNHALVSGLSVVGGQQSRYYWERAIAKDDSAYSNSYAKVASDTLKTLQNWNLTVDQVPDETPAAEYFKRWTNSYQQLLDKHKLITQQSSWQLIERGFSSGALPSEAEIYLYGFQSTPPLQNLVINSASNLVKQIETIDINPPTSDLEPDLSTYRIECQDPQTELRTAASWAAQQLKAKPQQRLGIIVPDLNNNLQLVARVVNEALKTEETEVLVNISAGTPLADTAVVHCALELIGSLQYKRSLNDWLKILYSPFSAFAQLPLQYLVDSELALRKTRRFDFTLEQFLTAILPKEEPEQKDISETDPHNPLILETLKPLIELKTFSRLKTGTQKNFSTWAQFFSNFLEDMGWPDARSLNSIEYQQRQQWNSLLDQYCGLDNLAIEVGLATALKHLQLLAQESVFHPKTADAPLQILGLLEGSGLHFDQLWIVGMHSKSFPASVAINPLLPADFQRQQAMPHSLPERELKIAQELLSGYKNHSKKLILSYPVLKGEEQLDPSPLIRDLADSKISELLKEPEPHPPWLSQPQQCQ